MSILIYNWRDIKNPDAGGAGVFAHENAKRWVGRGNEFTPFTFAFAGCEGEIRKASRERTRRFYPLIKKDIE
jgi:hypothetical protein